MAKRSILEEEEQQEINLSPMIDCIFILLIFFIVTTVFVEEKGLQVAKPDAAVATTTEESENVTVEITAENRVLVDDELVSLPELAGRVKALAVTSETPVVIRAHEKASHGTFVAVWDAAKRGGAEAVSFNTVN